MGTRNLTMVIQNGETKVAQYGQWDGYPSGQGATALDFLRNCDMNSFRERVSKLRWLTKEESEQIDTLPDWKAVHPYLSRDLGADILHAIYSAEFEANDYPNGKKKVPCVILGLIDQSDFAADSLFCEYAYVIDLDKNTFEIYEGFNKEPLAEGERFATLAKKKEDSEYFPVKHAKTYSLLDLPTEEQFLADLEPKEENA
jgi:hypothetical protein